MKIDRKYLIRYVSKKINQSIPLYHITAVVNFLFDEMITELQSGRTIAIGRFGKFLLKKLDSRRHYDVTGKKIKVSAGRRILRFRLYKDIQEILTNNLDVAKTFEEHENG